MEQLNRIAEIDTPEGHERFIHSQWRELAAFAWGRYLKEGRGAIVVDLRRASDSDSGLRAPTFYIAEGSERLAKLGGWPSDEVAEIVRDYDPQQDVVFIFLKLDGDYLFYQASDDLTPPRAFESKQKAEY